MTGPHVGTAAPRRKPWMVAVGWIGVATGIAGIGFSLTRHPIDWTQAARGLVPIFLGAGLLQRRQDGTVRTDESMVPPTLEHRTDGSDITGADQPARPDDSGGGNPGRPEP